MFASPDGASPRIVTATLRDWTQRLARTTTKTHRASAEDDKRGPRLLLFTRVAMAGGQEAHITVAYDRLASGRLEAVAKLVEGPLLARLRKHFASIATKMP